VIIFPVLLIIAGVLLAVETYYSTIPASRTGGGHRYGGRTYDNQRTCYVYNIKAVADRLEYFKSGRITS